MLAEVLFISGEMRTLLNTVGNAEVYRFKEGLFKGIFQFVTPAD